jgi:hypothetical protein
VQPTQQNGCLLLIPNSVHVKPFFDRKLKHPNNLFPFTDSTDCNWWSHSRQRGHGACRSELQSPCELAIAPRLLVVTISKCSINPITNPDPVGTPILSTQLKWLKRIPDGIRRYNFFVIPISFAICISTFSKLCKRRIQWHVEECSLALPVTNRFKASCGLWE